MEKRASHRPQRSYPNAERVIIACELETCIHCSNSRRQVEGGIDTSFRKEYAERSERESE